MERSRTRMSAVFARAAWPVWVIYTVVWSLALLTPQPIHLRDAILSEKPAIVSSKLLHIGGYLVFTILTASLRLAVPYRWFLLIFLSIHAVGTEYFQQFVPRRTPSLHDVAFDHIGIALGLAISWKWWLPARSPTSAESL